MESMTFLAIAIFALSFIVIISEKIHRTVVAIAGATIMILLGVITQEQAIEGVDFNTLGLLIGMMMIVGIAKESGLFQYIAITAAKVVKGKPLAVFFLIGTITAFFSALLDNVTTVLLMVPVTFVIANNLKIKPMPFLFGIILCSNIGGAATLIGDPPNILIGSAAELSFNQFLFHLGPIVLLSFLLAMGMLLALYRSSFQTTPEAQAAIMKFNPKDALTDRPLLIKSLIVFFLVLTGFLTHAITHIDVATIALAGAALLLLLTLNDPEDHLRDVEWSTIFFFVGLFVIVTGLEHTGIIHSAAEGLLHLTAGKIGLTSMLILWGSAITSAIVDNIPFVTVMIPLIHDITAISTQHSNVLWWALALGADFGGNATLIGASANLVVRGMAERAGHDIGFVAYSKVAIPITVAVLLLSSGYLFLRYLI